MGDKQDQELTKTVIEWIEGFDSHLEKAKFSEKESIAFKRGLLVGLEKGLEIGQLAGEQGLEIKLKFGGK